MKMYTNNNNESFEFEALEQSCRKMENIKIITAVFARFKYGIYNIIFMRYFFIEIIF